MDAASVHEALLALGSLVELEQGWEQRVAALSLVGTSELRNPQNHTVVFALDAKQLQAPALGALQGCLLVVPQDSDPSSLGERNVVVLAKEPKFAYAKLMSSLFPITKERGRLRGSRGQFTVIDPSAQIAKDVTIEDFVTIAAGVSIGEGGYVMRGACLNSGVTLGRDCIVGENSVLGDRGFGYGMVPGEAAVHIPQRGGLIIGDDVEIGALCSIAVGAIEPTRIADSVKINSHARIAHNCQIGPRVMIGGSASILGSVTVGAGAWISPGVIIRNKVAIGEGAFLGMGAVVVADVPPNVTVYGNPAKEKART